MKKTNCRIYETEWGIDMINKNEVLKMYNGGASPYEIAEKFGTYTNKIRRMLIKDGVKLRDKSEAQKSAIATGRAKHPTEGKERTDAEKLAISSSAVKYWEDMPEEERESRVEKSKEAWKAISPVKKDAMRKKAAAEIRKAAKSGSKLEKEVQKMLIRGGYRYEAHKKDLIPTQKLEIDLFVPSLRTIIEVDGLSHFEPIWGEEQFAKQVQFDAQKDGIVLGKGFKVIRIENLSGSMALAKLAKLEKDLMLVLEEIENETVSSNLKVIAYE